MRVAAEAAGSVSFQGAWTVQTPGGTIGAQLLQLLVPYLPNTVERRRLEQAIARHELVPFQSAELLVTIRDPQHIKTVLTMAIPEYNLLLDHVTVEIRLEDPEILTQLGRLLRTVTE